MTSSSDLPNIRTTWIELIFWIWFTSHRKFPGCAITNNHINDLNVYLIVAETVFTHIWCQIWQGPKHVALLSSHRRISGCVRNLIQNLCPMWPFVFVLPASWAAFPEINILSHTHNSAFCLYEVFFIKVCKRYRVSFPYQRMLCSVMRHVTLQRTQWITASLSASTCCSLSPFKDIWAGNACSLFHGCDTH